MNNGFNVCFILQNVLNTKMCTAAGIKERVKEGRQQEGRSERKEEWREKGKRGGKKV